MKNLGRILAFLFIFCSPIAYCEVLDNSSWWTLPRIAEAWEKTNTDAEYYADVVVPKILKEWSDTRNNISKNWETSNELVSKIIQPSSIFIGGILFSLGVSIPATACVLLVKLFEYRNAGNARIDSL